MDMEDQGSVVFKMLARPLAAGCEKRHGALVIGKNITQLSMECAPRQLEEPTKELENLSYALVVTGHRGPARDVVTDVLGEELTPQCVEVAAPEGREAFPHQYLVRMCHLAPP